MRTLLMFLFTLTLSGNALAVNAEDVLIKREILVENASMAFCTEISLKDFAWSQRKCLPLPRFFGPDKYKPFLEDSKVLITNGGKSACVYAAPFNDIAINEFLVCVDNMDDIYSMAYSGLNDAEVTAKMKREGTYAYANE